MANPNILAVQNLNAKSINVTLTTTPTNILTASAGTVVKINNIVACNKQDIQNTISLSFYRNSVAYRLLPNIKIEASKSVEALSRYFYLEEGDSLQAFTLLDGMMDCVISYEVITS